MSTVSLLEAELPTDVDIDKDFFNDVIQGLSQSQKSLPCKYFYNDRGSQLFEQICSTSEYYVTRTESKIYRDFSGEMAEVIGSDALILEPGAGSVQKIALLLEHLESPVGFVPMDISPEILSSSSEALAELFPELDISPAIVDFSDKEQLHSVIKALPKRPLVKKRVIFFPGSTIGNFYPHDAQQFLQSFAENLETKDGLLIGVDLVKDSLILEAAYNDREGVTADFNFNLLWRIRDELGATISLENFSHKAVFNIPESRIEMHLVSDIDQQILLGDYQFEFLRGETIHTENSYKYSIEKFTQLAEKAGYRLKNTWVDSDKLFSVHYLEVR